MKPYARLIVVSLFALAFLGISATATKKPMPRPRPKPRIPVQVFVTRVPRPKGITYEYRVVNRAEAPIARILIGFHYVMGEPELNYGPAGLSDAGVPPTSYGSPPGWTFRMEETEEDPRVDIEWAADTHDRDIAVGSSLEGFQVVLSDTADDRAYETSHWVAHLNDGGIFYGRLMSRTSSRK